MTTFDDIQLTSVPRSPGICKQRIQVPPLLHEKRVYKPSFLLTCSSSIQNLAVLSSWFVACYSPGNFVLNGNMLGATELTEYNVAYV